MQYSKPFQGIKEYLPETSLHDRHHHPHKRVDTLQQMMSCFIRSGNKEYYLYVKKLHCMYSIK